MIRIEMLLDDWEEAALRTVAVRTGLEPIAMARALLRRELAREVDSIADQLLSDPSVVTNGRVRRDDIEMRLVQLFHA